MNHQQIKNMFARGNKSRYARIIVDFRQQK